LAPVVVGKGVILERRAQFISLQSNNNFTLSIINVYALNSSHEKTLLNWNKLVEANVSGQSYILTGDFNMVESESNRLGSSRGCTNTNQREKAA